MYSVDFEPIKPWSIHFTKKNLSRSKEYGVKVVVPDRMERDTIHSIIYDELIKGIVKNTSAEKYKAIVRNLVSKGAEGIILGCTEFSMLVKEEEYSIPLFDTTYLHAADAVEKALE